MEEREVLPTSTFLEDLTFSIRELYHAISPDVFPPPEYPIGHPLNLPDESEEVDPAMLEGHRIVCINEIFEDSNENHLRVISVLGNGTFSYVFKCQIVHDPSQFVALKIIKNLQQYHATGISEIMIHQKLSSAPPHPGKEFVINPISTFEVEGHICMVLPLLYRSLFEGISQTQSISTLLLSIRLICTQLLQALDFIHSNGVIHCDLKPDNILFANEDFSRINLIDFGSATFSQGGIGQYIQSRFYRSPEIILGLPYNSQIDLWSAGAVFAELFLDFAIFACDTEIDTIHSMLALLGPISPELLAKSHNLKRFFDIDQNGFHPKKEPQEVLLTLHSYHAIYEQIGPVPLHQLILEHCSIQCEEELLLANCFSHFVHGLLRYDPNERWNAAQALMHPFITGELFSEDWNPPPIPKVAPAPILHPLSRTPPPDNDSSDIFNMM